MNENSSGSVIPVNMEAIADPINIEATIFFFSGFAVWIKANAAPGKANIMIGKKPVVNIPAFLSPARKRQTSPWITSPAAFVKSPS
ncbi:hypothetical protein D3C81_2062990 [compost metagenome]